MAFWKWCVSWHLAELLLFISVKGFTTDCGLLSSCGMFVITSFLPHAISFISYAGNFKFDEIWKKWGFMFRVHLHASVQWQLELGGGA